MLLYFAWPMVPHIPPSLRLLQALEVTGKGVAIAPIKMGLSENRVYSQLKPFNRDNDP